MLKTIEKEELRRCCDSLKRLDERVWTLAPSALTADPDAKRLLLGMDRSIEGIIRDLEGWASECRRKTTEDADVASVAEIYWVTMADGDKVRVEVWTQNGVFDAVVITADREGDTEILINGLVYQLGELQKKGVDIEVGHSDDETQAYTMVRCH